MVQLSQIHEKEDIDRAPIGTGIFLKIEENPPGVAIKTEHTGRYEFAQQHELFKDGLLVRRTDEIDLIRIEPFQLAISENARGTSGMGFVGAQSGEYTIKTLSPNSSQYQAYRNLLEECRVWARPK